jgi:nucleotide-binding universal stress UspA family protein
MDAYAHGPWREMLFGGVTRSVLEGAAIPVLMRH